MVTGLIDASTLDNASTDPRLSIEKISWNTKTSAGYFSVVFDADTDVHNLPYTISPELLDTYFLEIF